MTTSTYPLIAGVPARRPQARRALMTIVVVAAAIGVVVAVPGLAGTSWPAVGTALGAAHPVWVAVLPPVWVAALLSYSLVLRASLPGLSTRQALSLNLAGTAVANAVPLGGALSMGLTAAMARSWRFTAAGVGAYFTVSGVWTALARIVVGLLGLALLTWSSAATVHLSGVGAVATSISVLALAVGVVLGRERSTAATAAAAGRLLDAIMAGRRGPARSRAARFRAVAVESRRLTLDISRRSWPRIVLGQVGYVALLTVLMYVCLLAVGHPLPWAVVVAAVGVERLAGTVPLTPGGIGVTDLALVAVLASAGNPPAAVAAALLYRLFTFALEIPAGAVIGLGWFLARPRSESTPVVVEELS